MVQPDIDKHELLAELRACVQRDLDTLIASQESAQSGAIHEENRQEHPKDTRAIEAQYLARGLAERAEALRDAVTMLAALRLSEFGEDDPVAVGALVALDFDGDESLYFLMPTAGGERLAIGDSTIQTLTPASPLGRAIAGRKVGDTIEVELPAGRREAELLWSR